MVAPAIIRIKNVKKVFKKNIVLDNVNLDIKRGEIFGIIGMSGSGKTTLLNTIVGFLQPEEGDVLFQSGLVIERESSKNMMSVFSHLIQLRKIFGFAPQLPSFYTQLSAEENLDYFASLYGLTKEVKKSNIKHLLELTGLTEAKDTLASDLSGGMKKRLGIACALVHKPDILILDEPTADLDPVLRDQTWELIRKINHQGTSVIIASHFVEEIESLCNRIGVLHDGKVLSVGSPLKLKDIYTTDNEIKLETASLSYSALISRLKSIKALKVNKIKQQGKRLVIYSEKGTDTLRWILKYLKSKNEKLVFAEVNKPSLREVFTSLALGRPKLHNGKMR
ncbi:ABC transporter ATP-binding protein [Candidatus Woesearchaeota archaeon]|nr:ABC transporter ATP-binding protein [Candidatus Woesearchaeota archaeon]